MSFIELTGKKMQLGQCISVKHAVNNGVDIFLHEGRVHIDREDADVLRRRLFELMKT